MFMNRLRRGGSDDKMSFDLLDMQGRTIKVKGVYVSTMDILSGPQLYLPSKICQTDLEYASHIGLNRFVRM